MQIYFENFSSKQDVISNYSIKEDDIKDYDILFAYYTYQNYEGESLVILRDKSNGKLYEVNGSHCSCYGLEGQWELEETNIEALMKRDTDFFNEVVKQHIKSFNDKKVLTQNIKSKSNKRTQYKI